MDFSKLPKLSQTPAPPPADQPGAAPSAAGDAPVVTPQAVELFCRCGAPIVAGTEFCAHCGASYRQVLRGEGGGAAARAGGGDEGPGMWVEAFFSIAMGLFLMLMASNGIKYLWASASGKPFTPYLHPSEANVYVDYVQFQHPTTLAVTQYRYRDMFNAYWSDMCVTLFALALVVEGVVLALVRNRWAVLASALLIVGVTLLNLWYVIASYSRVDPISLSGQTYAQAYGLPMLSALAVILGVVMAGYQFMMFGELRRGRLRR